MNRSSAIAWNTVLAAGARVIGTALAFVVVAIVARSLGTAAFGEYTLILSFLFTVQVLADGGLYSLLLREISRPAANVARIVGTITTLRVTLLVVVLGIVPFVVWLLPYGSSIPLGVAIGAVGFFFLSFSQLLMAIFQKELWLGVPAVAEIVARGVQLMLVLGAAVIGGSLFLFLWAVVASAVVQWGIMIIFARRRVPFRLTVDMHQWRQYTRAALPIAASVVLTMVYFRVDSIFLSLSAINGNSPDPLVDVGLYGVAYKVFEALIFYPTMFVGLLMPLLSRFAVEDRERLRHIAHKGARTLFMVALPAAVGLVLVAGPVVRLVGGVDFVAAASLLQILAAALGFVFFGALFGHILIALNRQTTAAWIYGAGVVVNVVANILVIPAYRAAGAAMTTLVTEVLVTILLGIVVARSGIGISWRFVPAVVVATAALATAVWWISAPLAVEVLVGAGIYTATLWALGGITKEEVTVLLGGVDE